MVMLIYMLFFCVIVDGDGVAIDGYGVV